MTKNGRDSGSKDSGTKDGNKGSGSRTGRATYGSDNGSNKPHSPKPRTVPTNSGGPRTNDGESGKKK